MAAENREQEWMERRMNVFKTRAFLLVTEIRQLSEEPAVPQELVKEALHSIFFLGKIIKVSPNEIFADGRLMPDELQQSYREACDDSSYVPKRHPMSCVLDMIVKVKGERNENDIKQRLQDINRLLTGREIRPELQWINNQLRGCSNLKILISTAMCVSQNTETPNSVRYYGVSISAFPGRSREIMIAVSCCNYWDPRVAEAVMTYYPDNVISPYFDGTIRLPETVRCQAFKISDGKEMSPCRSCGNLFGLGTTKTNVNLYGNCAEVESLSNLFKIERFQVPSTLNILGNLLSEADFEWNNDFYPTV